MSSIIGHLADEKKGIRENCEERYIEFYVVGYTKKCQNINVQTNHALLFSDAMKIAKPLEHNPNICIWPFGNKSSDIATISLHAEYDNKHDPYALIIRALYPLNFEAFIRGESKEKIVHTLGYVPQQISRAIYNHLDRLKGGWIKKVRSIHNGKHCVTKVAIPWSIDKKETEPAFFNRIASIIDSLDEENV